MDREPVSGRLVYFFFYASAAALVPMLTLYYESLGISGRLLGILAAIWPAGNVVGAALWGAVADATGRHRLVLILAAATAIAAAQLFLLGSTFLSLVPVVILFSLSVAPIIPVVDNAVLDALGKRRSHYGRVRLWGAVGWGVSAPLLGIAVDSAGLRIVFPVYGALMLLTLTSSFLLPISRSSIGTNVRAGLRVMASDRRWLVFLLIVLIRGIGGAFILHFLFIYLNAIGGSGTLRGIALAVATAGEIVTFFFGHRILRRIGPRRAILIALAATALRLFLYSIIDNPQIAVLVQVLHGLTFSLYLVAGVNYAKEIAPAKMGATAQAVFASTSIGGGGIVGAILGGILYEALGIQRMFLVAAIFLLAAFVLFALTFGRRGASTSAGAE
jgi:PPP family 3-phenylpropionic acid transporter